MKRLNFRFSVSAPILMLVFSIATACSLPLPGVETEITRSARSAAETLTSRLDDAILGTLSAEVTRRGQITPPIVGQVPTLVMTPTFAGLSPTAPPTLTPGPTAGLPTLTPFFSGTPTPSRTPAAGITPSITDPVSRLGSPAWQDSLNTARYWPIGSDDYTSGTVENGFLQLTGLTHLVGWRIATTPALSDFYVEARFQSGSCSGVDAYGIIFRIPVKSEPDQGYLFYVNCLGQYSLKRWNGKEPPAGKMDVLISWKNSTAIKAGSSQDNRLGVLASGDLISLYINGLPVDTTRDGAFLSGYFGALIQAGSPGVPYTVFLDDAAYWTNLTVLSQ